MLQRMTISSKETYREYRKGAKKLCREKKTEMLKGQIGSIELNQIKAEKRKYYQTMNRFRKGFQPRLKACKDNNGKLIEGEDKMLENWARYLKTQFERENS